MRALPRLAALAAGLLASGCTAPGLVYTRITRPLTVNFLEAPVVLDGAPAEGDVKSLRFRVELRWDVNAIGELAKTNGIEEVYYADEEILSVLGIWRQRFVHVYGRALPGEEPGSVVVLGPVQGRGEPR